MANEEILLDANRYAFETILSENNLLRKINAELKARLNCATELLRKYHEECPDEYSFEDIDDMCEQFLEQFVEAEKFLNNSDFRRNKWQ